MLHFPKSALLSDNVRGIRRFGRACPLGAASGRPTPTFSNIRKAVGLSTPFSGASGMSPKGRPGLLGRACGFRFVICCCADSSPPSARSPGFFKLCRHSRLLGFRRCGNWLAFGVVKKVQVHCGSGLCVGCRTGSWNHVEHHYESDRRCPGRGNQPHGSNNGCGLNRFGR